MSHRKEQKGSSVGLYSGDDGPSPHPLQAISLGGHYTIIKIVFPSGLEDGFNFVQFRLDG